MLFFPPTDSRARRWAGSRDGLRRSLTRPIPWAAGVVMTAVSAWVLADALGRVTARERARDAADLELTLQLAAERLSAEISEAGSVLRGMSSVVTRLEVATFDAAAYALMQDRPWIHSVALAPRGRIERVVPVSRAAAVEGLVMTADPVDGAALELASRRGEFSLGTPRAWNSRGLALDLRVPVHTASHTPGSYAIVSMRWPDFDRFVELIPQRPEGSQLQLWHFDRQAQRFVNVYAGSEPESTAPTRTLRLHDASWRLSLTPKPATIEATRLRTLLSTASISMLLGLLTALCLSQRPGVGPRSSSSRASLRLGNMARLRQEDLAAMRRAFAAAWRRGGWVTLAWLPPPLVASTGARPSSRDSTLCRVGSRQACMSLWNRTTGRNRADRSREVLGLRNGDTMLGLTDGSLLIVAAGLEHAEHAKAVLARLAQRVQPTPGESDRPAPTARVVGLHAASFREPLEVALKRLLLRLEQLPQDVPATDTRSGPSPTAQHAESAPTTERTPAFAPTLPLAESARHVAEFRATPLQHTA